ncbi:MAG: HK97 family phage prohead protease [Candidatus Methanomethylophilaceae archaeon]
MERRYFQIKALGDKTEDQGHFKGVLSTYGNIDEVGDICEPGCFDLSISKRGTKRTLLWQHNWDAPIGQFDIVKSDDDLSIEGSFNMDVDKGREGYSLLKRGDINGLSIGYTITDYEYDKDGIRHLKVVDLWEGSLVTFPANTLATAEAKSMKQNVRKQVAGLPFLRKLTDEERAEAIADIEAILERYSSDPKADEDVTDPNQDGDTEDDDTDDIDDAKADEELEAELGKAKELLLEFKEVVS